MGIQLKNRSQISKMREANLVVDMIVQNVPASGDATDVSFTVEAADLPETLRIAEASAREVGATRVTHDPTVAKVSVGAIRDFRLRENVTFGVGALYSRNFVPGDLEPAYGGDPDGAMAFVRLRIG